MTHEMNDTPNASPNQEERPPSSDGNATPSGEILKAGTRKSWAQGLTVPLWLSLSAIVLSAFLAFPAVKGFTLGRETGRLKEEIKQLQGSLLLVQAQGLKPDQAVAHFGSQNVEGEPGFDGARGVGLFVSPILPLEPKKAELPDLIQIDFRNKADAVLAFDGTRFNFTEVRLSLFQEGNVVWSQTLAMPRKTLFVQNVMTFVLNQEAMAKGDYRIRIEGDPSRGGKTLGEYDLRIEK
ncbi:MAG: hypothetical protein U0V70_14435 [Terriglobia bacterium]